MIIFLLLRFLPLFPGMKKEYALETIILYD